MVPLPPSLRSAFPRPGVSSALAAHPQKHRKMKVTEQQLFRYQDRCQAGCNLAKYLESYRRDSDVLVLAVQKGGVPVAYEVASALEAELDALLVRNLSVPGYEEVEMGAVARGGVTIRNRDVLKSHLISNVDFTRVKHREFGELFRREFVYRGERRFPQTEGRSVILVDDGLATTSMLEAAVKAIRRRGAAQVVIAIPVAPKQIVEQLMDLANDVICPVIPSHFDGVTPFYREFSEVSDDEACELLEKQFSSVRTSECKCL